ncbi:LysR family transcriptional regulator [Rhizobium hidalgonense]|uniref:HTH-type transcriptional regulator TtuA n=1 Tax=Rhizobium hidalgonense TaxID=1538159 RepID=A0A2A6KLQ8_9HYPH|nr:LysR family transcriptional regulator [Rhizobium hidalgonense]MDR9771481.1 LysR family transcriptional regulator [Rhizobium hidalgonense]MDR9808962.1 LysR family transcriptional regulator [Rhizobium hidalgonense]MDR9818488.1 LysR family transcriptional regulator [Rhizobium hidalgonense]PDT25468.1 LysR family transcriptional regulator [Rhizobium hidalgonense]PON07603.1 LysR family transcriptional regulator [Rhizobium hidalgonense]
MNPRQLKTFLAVIRHENLTRAAAEVNLAQSSLSDQIQALEEELGAELFLRSRQGVALTAAGAALKTYAEEILALNDEAKGAVRAAAGNADQSVSVGTLETIAAETLAPWLSLFGKQNPGLGLKLKIGGSGELRTQLHDGSIDVAFTFDRGQQDERFATRRVSSEPLVLIAGRNAHARPPESLAALSTAPFIATESGCVYRHLFETAFAEAGVPAPPIVTEADSIATIIRLVASGAGYGLVPGLALGPSTARGDVIALPWPGEPPTAALLMMWRRRRVQPPALALLLQSASNKLLPAASDELSPVRPADARLRHAG